MSSFVMIRNDVALDGLLDHSSSYMEYLRLRGCVWAVPRPHISMVDCA